MSKRKKLEGEVDVPIVPMLDMAFQLLTFFILTYNPAPQENQFAMSLLPTLVKTQGAGSSNSTEEVMEDVKTIPVSLTSDGSGALTGITLGETAVEGEDLYKALQARLKADFLAEAGAFDKASISVEADLKYSELIKVVNVFVNLGITQVSFGLLKGA